MKKFLLPKTMVNFFDLFFPDEPFLSCFVHALIHLILKIKIVRKFYNLTHFYKLMRALNRKIQNISH